MNSHHPSYINSYLHLFNVENFRIICVTTCEVFIKMSHHLVNYLTLHQWKETKKCFIKFNSKTGIGLERGGQTNLYDITQLILIHFYDL